MGKERPILFSGPMVRAILDGRKTQTRRVVKNAPSWAKEWGFSTFTPSGHISARGISKEGSGEKFIRLTYGAPGDRLWVRETWAIDVAEMPPIDVNGNPTCREVARYRATDSDPEAIVRWAPAIYMPRDLARIILEITDVRVERLNDISPNDAIAEGAGVTSTESHRGVFARLWDSINGEKAPWKSNPWVWVVSFKRVETKAKAANE